MPCAAYAPGWSCSACWPGSPPKAPAVRALVCGNTHALTTSGIVYAPQQPVILRGRSTATEVWLALSAAQPPDQDPEIDRTPLIHREHELGLLVNALHRSLRD